MSVDYCSFVLYGIRLPYDLEFINIAENNNIEYYINGNQDYVYFGKSLSQVWQYSTQQAKFHDSESFINSDLSEIYFSLQDLFKFNDQDFGVWHVITAY